MKPLFPDVKLYLACTLCMYVCSLRMFADDGSAYSGGRYICFLLNLVNSLAPSISCEHTKIKRSGMWWLYGPGVERGARVNELRGSLTDPTAGGLNGRDSSQQASKDDRFFCQRLPGHCFLVSLCLPSKPNELEQIGATIESLGLERF